MKTGINRKSIRKNFGLLVTYFAFCIVSYSSGQGTIGTITFSPATPTSNDTIKIFVPCTFTSGNCPLSQLGTNVTGNTLSASAVHCLGMLTVICDITDTVVFPPLLAGTYNFIFVLSEGLLPVPCTPGITPSDLDSIQIIVGAASGISESHSSGGIAIFSNKNKVHIHADQNMISTDNLEMKLYNGTGQLLKSCRLNASENIIEVSNLQGVCFVGVFNGTELISKKAVLISNP